MLALERRNEILEKLHMEKAVLVSELSRQYMVSEETIRRDLDKLEKEGYATKSYGGAVLNEDLSIDLPFNVRKNRNTAGKQVIAELAASLVREGSHIFLDASTTAVFIAKALKKMHHLTVLTNSVEILLELSDVSGWEILATGGQLKEDYLAFLGPRAEEAIRSYYADLAITSCKALHPQYGAMDSQEPFATSKRVMLSQAEKRILAVDSSKFGQTAFCQVANLKEMDILVTDTKPSQDWLDRFDEAGLKCLYPQET